MIGLLSADGQLPLFRDAQCLLTVSRWTAAIILGCSVFANSHLAGCAARDADRPAGDTAGQPHPGGADPG